MTCLQWFRKMHHCSMHRAHIVSILIGKLCSTFINVCCLHILTSTKSLILLVASDEISKLGANKRSTLARLDVQEFCRQTALMVQRQAGATPKKSCSLAQAPARLTHHSVWCSLHL